MELNVALPLFGFEQIKTFTLEKIDDFFYKLSHGEIAFTLIDPSKIREYTFEIPDFYAEKLALEEGDKVKVLAIMVLQDPIEESVVNFLAPVVINESKKLLVQIPLDEQKYPDFALAEKIGRYL